MLISSLQHSTCTYIILYLCTRTTFLLNEQEKEPLTSTITEIFRDPKKNVHLHVGEKPHFLVSESKMVEKCKKNVDN